MTNRNVMAKGGAVALLALLIAVGAIGLYDYTRAPPPNSAVSSSSSQNETNSSQEPSGGHFCSEVNAYGQCLQPEGAWALYLGFIPSGYVLAPHYATTPDYPYPAGMSPSQCAVFQSSCGNGVCDPNESCATCPIDCGVVGQLTCDPYTGRAGAPNPVCQVG
jgi:hypothetical protein